MAGMSVTPLQARVRCVEKRRRRPFMGRRRAGGEGIFQDGSTTILLHSKFQVKRAGKKNCMNPPPASPLQQPIPSASDVKRRERILILNNTGTFDRACYLFQPTGAGGGPGLMARHLEPPGITRSTCALHASAPLEGRRIDVRVHKSSLQSRSTTEWHANTGRYADPGGSLLASPRRVSTRRGTHDHSCGSRSSWRSLSAAPRISPRLAPLSEEP